MGVVARALRTFDDWVLEPPYRPSVVPWPWHLALSALVLLSAVGLVAGMGWFAAAAAPILGLMIAQDARRAFVNRYPDRRRDGRPQDA